MPKYFVRATNFSNEITEVNTKSANGLSLSQLQKLNSQYDKNNVNFCSKIIQQALKQYLEKIGQSEKLDQIKLIFKEEQNAYYAATILLSNGNEANPRFIVGYDDENSTIWLCLELSDTTDENFVLPEPWQKQDDILSKLQFPKPQELPINVETDLSLSKHTNSTVKLSKENKRNREKLVVPFFNASAFIGFLITIGLSVGFIFSAPAIISLISAFLSPLPLAGTLIGISFLIAAIAGAAVAVGLVTALFNLFTWGMIKNEKSKINWLLRTLVLASLMGGLAAGLIFGAAPAVGAVIVSQLGMTMTIASLIIGSLLISQAINLLDPLFGGVNSDSSFFARIFKINFRAVLIALPLAGLTLGIVFGAAPTLGAMAAATFAGILPAALSITTISALATTMVVLSIILAAMAVGFTTAIGFAMYGRIYQACMRNSNQNEAQEELPPKVDTLNPNFKYKTFDEADPDVTPNNSSTTPGCSIFGLLCGSTTKNDVTEDESKNFFRNYEF